MRRADRTPPTAVLVVIAPGVLLLDLAGVAEPFRVANQWCESAGRPPAFALRMVGTRGRVPTSLPLQLAGIAPLPRSLPPGAWVVVAGISEAAALPASSLRRLSARSAGGAPAGRPALTHGGDGATVAWLRRVVGPAVSEGVARVWTVCSGAFMAARAGLLDGRQCTTHHTLIDRLATEHPAARVQANRIFVVDGPIATSAGITAGVDLALHAIGEALGQEAALATARELVVFHRRAGGDPQMAAALRHRNHLQPALHRAQDAVLSDPASPWTVQRMADAAEVTPRHLARLFRDNVGVAPLDYLQEVRIDLARALLADRELPIWRVAEQSGFSSAHHMRRVWRRVLGGAPRDQALQG
jgi:transcriptional regulator GlxA family with amidase domain